MFAIRTVIVCLSVLAFAGSTPCLAQSKDELAHDLVRLLRYDKQFEQLHEACLAAAKQLSPEALVAANPDKFGGILPDSEYWPLIVDAFTAYYGKMCSKPTKEEFLEALASGYADALSDSELAEALSFYRSKAGQRLIPGHKSAAARANDEAIRAMGSALPVAAAELDRMIEEAVQRKNAKPLKDAL